MRSPHSNPRRDVLERQTASLKAQIAEHLHVLHQGWVFGTEVVEGRSIDLDDFGCRARNAATLCRAAAAAGELPALLENLESNRRLLAREHLDR